MNGFLEKIKLKDGKMPEIQEHLLTAIKLLVKYLGIYLPLNLYKINTLQDIIHKKLRFIK